MHRIETMTQYEKEKFLELENTKDHTVNTFAKMSLKIDEIARAINDIQDALLEKGIMKLQ